MKYALIVIEHANDLARRTGPDAKEYWAAWGAYVSAVRESGIMVSGAGLELPSTATTVRHQGGKAVIHDGPYAESKEVLAGFFLIDVPDLDTALKWAAKAPCPQGAVEIRPVLSPRP